MPVQACSRNGKPGYQWGDSGKCYTYSRGNDASRKRAKRKAHLQGAAAQANGAREMEDVSEFDDSLNDYIDLIRAEFEKAFPYRYNPDGSSVWYYVVDVFEDYLVCKAGGDYFEVQFEETEDGITFEEREKWSSVKLSYVAEMLSGDFRDTLIISEFKGKYPDIPIFSDVEIQELTGGEENPVFVTLPIGMANVTSGNNRYYDEKFLSEMERQVVENKPIGLMGHLSKEERATAFPAEAVHWVGVKRINEFLWGKGYVPAGEPRNRLQRYKATGKKIATSIDAVADGVWDATLGAYRMIAETLQLNQIDIAPADRAGIPNLAAVPLLTTEMLDRANGSSKPSVSTEDEMPKEDVIKELKSSDASLLPDEVRTAIIGATLQELRQTLGLPEGADVMAEIRKIREDSLNASKTAVSNRISELVSDEANGIKIKAVRGMVTELVKARNPTTPQEAETIYSEVVASPAVQEALQFAVTETMGPPQRTPVQPQAEQKQGKYFIKPVAKKEEDE